MKPTIKLIRDGYPNAPGMDIAVSRALLLRASEGEITETFRLNIPGRVMAFGKRDTLTPGYPAAVVAAHTAGFRPVERLAGGRAAVFHEGTFAFSWTIPASDPRSGIKSRFSLLTDLMVAAFARIGIEGEVGQVPGEYCPGDHSVHHDGRIKLMGVGQRLARGAAHIGGVVMVTNSALAREALIPVYEALQLDWNPATVGALQDIVPGLTMQSAAAAIETELSAAASLEAVHLDETTIDLARTLAPDHVSTSTS